MSDSAQPSTQQSSQANLDSAPEATGNSGSSGAGAATDSPPAAFDTNIVNDHLDLAVKALLDLQTMIRDSVFKEKSVDLIICDDQFKPILNINK